MDWRNIKAALFDLDGVLTPTAEVHRRAWAHMFNSYLADVAGQHPFTDTDYFAQVDGKPRYDGVRDFLTSRSIALPEGRPDDSPREVTVHGLGNRKNAEVTRMLADEGVTAYPGSVQLLELLAAQGIRQAVVSSSRNAPLVLSAAGIESWFDLVVDGTVAERERLAGKPAPDTFRYAARQLGIPVADCAVIEDAESGVQAGAAGGFGLVIGVDRGVGAATLEAAGAHVVVRDLKEVLG
ncbi:MAG: HAD family hydrolase [Propioniciclava sp.]